jgi:hypothetical protein
MEVTRLCTDGVPNGCSMLYAATRRAGMAKGFRRGLTYILDSEHNRFRHIVTGEERNEPALMFDPEWGHIGGASLRAAGWHYLWTVKGRTWDCPSRPRTDKHPTEDKHAYGWGAWPQLADLETPNDQ